MAKNISQVYADIEQIRLETVSKANTAGRVGQTIKDIYTQSVENIVSEKLKSLSDVTIDRLKALVFEALTRSGAASPSTFEKGVATDIDFSYSVSPNDNKLSSLIWDGDSLNLEPESLTGNKTYNSEDKTSVTLEIRVETGEEFNLNIASTALIPQWKGVSTLDDIPGEYAQLNDELTKVVQSGDNQSAALTLSNQYAYFVSTNENATIKDGNGFSQTVGAWDDGVSEFYKKRISVTLADGQTESMSIYRTRTQKNTTVTYNLS